MGAACACGAGESASERYAPGGKPLVVEVFPIGSRVHLINYSSFRGLKGTIMAIHMIADALDEPFRFYLIALEGVHVKEPIWFDYTEVELLAPPSVVTFA